MVNVKLNDSDFEDDLEGTDLFEDIEDVDDSDELEEVEEGEGRKMFANKKANIALIAVSAVIVLAIIASGIYLMV